MAQERASKRSGSAAAAAQALRQSQHAAATVIQSIVRGRAARRRQPARRTHKGHDKGGASPDKVMAELDRAWRAERDATRQPGYFLSFCTARGAVAAKSIKPRPGALTCSRR